MGALASTDRPSPVAASADDSGRGRSSLAPAIVVAVCLHAAAIAGLALYAPPAKAPPGENVISIDLAPQMTEADTQAPSETARSDAAPPEANPVDTPETVSQMKPPETEAVKPPETEAVKPADTAAVMPEEAPPMTPPDAQTAPPTEAVMEPPPEDQVVTSTAQQAEPLAPPPPTVAQTPEPPKEMIPVKPKPDLAKLEAKREARRREALEAKREDAREAAREAKVKAARDAARREAAANAGRAERSSASSSRQNSSGAAAAGNDPNALSAWKGALSSAIHGRMNRNAAAGTSGGVAVVRFTVSRSGQVLSAGLAGSSGVGAIDSAALATVRGSLPAAPSGVSVSSLAVTVPLRFSPGR